MVGILKLTLIGLLALILILTLSPAISDGHSVFPKKIRKEQKVQNLLECNQVPGYTQQLRDEIKSKQQQVDRIIELVLNGKEKHSTYDELALFCDTFGPRMSGSKSLSDAIDYMSEKMHTSDLVQRDEKAMIPRWEIGEQYAEILEPKKHFMRILALGFSVGTSGPIDAEAQIVHSFEELDALGKAGSLTGKIVVFNYNFTTYGESVLFREDGASKAAPYGALAALVRSVTPFSIYSPHAGSASNSIPTAAIATEDADLIQRWVNRQKTVKLRVFIDAKNYPDVEARNVIGDIVGSEKPDEFVIVSGHIDSWYNTQGAMDDAGGMMISYKALDVLRKLNITAKRTMRSVLWVAEEFGYFGAQQYFKDHRDELDKFKVVLESDLGTFKPLGLSMVNFGPLGQCVLRDLLSLTKRINTTAQNSEFEGSDISLFTNAGVPGVSLYNDNGMYFYYHHTSGDSISIENPDHLDAATILWATAAYVFADLDVDYKQ